MCKHMGHADSPARAMSVNGPQMWRGNGAWDSTRRKVATTIGALLAADDDELTLAEGEGAGEDALLHRSVATGG